jgi:hypothetical protein
MGVLQGGLLSCGAALSAGVPEVILLELMGACSKIVLPAGTSLGWPGDPAGQWFLLRHGTITSTTFQQVNK